MRVKYPMKNCRIVVSQNGREIASKKMKKAIPAEMIQLMVKGDRMEAGKDLEVRVE
jgi:hypothetical protein